MALTHSGQGELFNRGRARASERVDIDISHDALAGGCTLFNLEQFRQENSVDDFRNLFMCEFVDDKASVFPFEDLQRCMVDSLEAWEDFATQAESIRQLTDKYKVEYIGIDATGLGIGVFQLVRSFYPAARDIRYTPEMKTAMVLKANDVTRRGCLEYDVSATDITTSFMAIRKTMTSSGRSATYEASRTSSRRAPCSTYWSLTSIRSCTACRNISTRSISPG